MIILRQFEKEARDEFERRAKDLALNFYNEVFYNPDDHFSFSVFETKEELFESLKVLKEYTEIRGATRMYKDIVIQHLGQKEYRVSEYNGRYWQTIESWTVREKSYEKFIGYIDDVLSSDN